MSETKKSLRIIEKDVDLQSKRGIRAILSDGTTDVEKFIYPLMSTENDAFFDELKGVEHDYLPVIEGYFSGAGKRFAMTQSQEGSLMIECREKLDEKIAIEMCKDLAETMESIHDQGFAFAGLTARDILVNENGLVLPPPAFAATEEHIREDFAAVGGICYELLTGVEYKPGMVISADTLPDNVPYGAQTVIVNATSKDIEKNFTEAKPLIRAFDTKKKRVQEKAPKAPAPEKVRPVKPAEPQVRKAAPSNGQNTKAPAKKKKKKKKNPLSMLLPIVVVVIIGILAAVLLHSLLGNKGEDYDTLVNKAYLAVADGKYDEAIKLADQAEAEDGERLTAFYYEALALYKSGDYEKTVSFIADNIMKKSFTLKESESTMPQDLYYIYGCSYYQLGDYENAYKELSGAEEKGYDAAKTAPMLLKCALALDNSNAVAAVMQKDVMGDAGKSYTEASAEEASGNNNSAAVKYYETATKTEDSTLREYCIKRTVACYYKAEEFDSVINACDNSLTSGITMNLALDLLSHKAAAEKAKAKLANDDALFEEAIASYEKYMEVGGADVEAECNYSIGECYLYLRNAEEGKAALMKAYESNDPDWSEKAHAMLDANGLLEEQVTEE